MTVTAPEARGYVGISEISELTGLSQDTLRWYEKEGLFPRVDRGPDRRRRYSPRHVSLLRLLVRLRRTGMPTREMQEFSELLRGGARTHGTRMALLLGHRTRIVKQASELRADLAALDEKIEHYRGLISGGLDCDGAPVDEATARRQRSMTPGEGGGA
ncbi:MAG: MerR family transcriptional regulator [Pseudonocardiales bacterium]